MDLVNGYCRYVFWVLGIVVGIGDWVGNRVGRVFKWGK